MASLWTYAACITGLLRACTPLRIADQAQHSVQALAAVAQLLLGASSRNHDSILEHCSISSDSFGSLPVFDAAGQLVKYEVCSIPALFPSYGNSPGQQCLSVQICHFKEVVPFYIAL